MIFHLWIVFALKLFELLFQFRVLLWQYCILLGWMILAIYFIWVCKIRWLWLLRLICFGRKLKIFIGRSVSRDLRGFKTKIFAFSIGFLQFHSLLKLQMLDFALKLIQAGNSLFKRFYIFLLFPYLLIIWLYYSIYVGHYLLFERGQAERDGFI
jgi:hypothetical protein